MTTVALAAAASAQTLESIRASFRESLRDAKFASGLTGLVLSAEELELTGGRFRIDDPAGDTELVVYSLPLHTTRPWLGDDLPRVYLEGSFGFAEARERVTDLYGGQVPGVETSVSTRWRAYAGLLGLGLELPVADALTFTPIATGSLAWLDNKSLYGGPGAAVTAAIADGIAFNWDALLGSIGGAGRLDWHHPLGANHCFEMIARYDVRWTETLREDDDAQDFSTRTQMLTVRSDLTSPTGIRAFEQSLDWQATVAVREFLQGDLFDVERYVELGGALLAHTGNRLPFGQGFAVSGAIFVGDDFFGWTIGARLLF